MASAHPLREPAEAFLLVKRVPGHTEEFVHCRLHNPRSTTTTWTTFGETRSAAWAAVGALLPLAVTFLVTGSITQSARQWG